MLIEDSTAEKTPQVLPHFKFREQKAFHLLSMEKINEEDEEKEDEKIMY